MGIARSLLGACAALLVACGGHALSASTPGAVPARVPGGDWARFDYDAQRSGVGPSSTGITPRNVHSLSRRTVHLDGTVDSSPIELSAVRVRGRTRDAIVVTTTYGRTISLDARTGAKLWEYVPPGISFWEGSDRITNATPIADPNRRYVYAASPDGRIRKLVLATGREVRSRHWPARLTFDSTKEKIASALNISGSSVVAVTGGYLGDAPPYQGHVVMIDRSSGRITHVWNSLCSNRHRVIVPSSCPSTDSAIWARAGAVIEPGTGRILVATGNGPFDGFTDWGDSVLELTMDAGRLLHNWTPTDQAQLADSDTDLGSTAPAILPPAHGYRLIVQGGKDAILHLLNLNRLNGTPGGPGPRLGGAIEGVDAPRGGGVFTQPVVWSGAGGPYLFVADDSATAAYRISYAGGPHLVKVWETGSAGTSPVLAGGLLYVYDEQGGALDVYAPRSGRLLASLDAGRGHWNSPIVVGGRIILPTGNANDHTTSGTLYIYHLPGR